MLISTEHKQDVKPQPTTKPGEKFFITKYVVLGCLGFGLLIALYGVIAKLDDGAKSNSQPVSSDSHQVEPVSDQAQERVKRDKSGFTEKERKAIFKACNFAFVSAMQDREWKQADNRIESILSENRELESRIQGQGRNLNDLNNMSPNEVKEMNDLLQSVVNSLNTYSDLTGVDLSKDQKQPTSVNDLINGVKKQRMIYRNTVTHNQNNLRKLLDRQEQIDERYLKTLVLDRFGITMTEALTIYSKGTKK